jgi:hypothetical protein
MALIKKIDVEKYFAARRAMRLGRLGMVSQPAAAGNPPPEKKGSTLDCQSHPEGNFFSEHPAISIPITSDSGRNRLLRPPGSRQE